MASVSDNFDRSDGEIGADWTEDLGDIDIVSNHAQNIGSAGINRMRYTASALDSSNHEVEAGVEFLGSLGPDGGPTARQASSAATHYMALYKEEDGGAGYVLRKTLSGAETSLDTAASGNGEKTLKITVDGATQSMEVDTVEVCTDTDSDITTGLYAGVSGYKNYCKYDNWSAADLGAGGYTLTADSGSYIKTGQNVGLLADRKISIEAGNLTVTGTAAGLLRGYPLVADSGSFALSGQDVGLKKDSKISIDSGNFAITGQDASLPRGLLIAAENGAYALTGSDVTLTYTPVGGYTLIADSGTYSVTGIAVDLLHGYRLGIEVGSFVLSGQDVSLLKNYKLSSETGVYNITGQDAVLLRTHLFSAESGSYNISGQAASLLKGFVLGLESGGYSLTGQDIVLLRNAVIDAQTGSIILTGQDVDLIYSGLIDELIFINLTKETQYGISLSKAVQYGISLSDETQYNIALSKEGGGS